MSKQSQFWDRHAKGYAKSKISNEEAYQQKLKESQTYLNAKSELFEFGCGTGTTALHHAPLVKHIHAVDISPKMLEIAKRKAEQAGVDNITFEVGDFDTFEGQSKQYDMVMGHSILHLVNDKEKAIAQAYQMLKPGGVFISSTACLEGAMSWLKLILPVGYFFGLVPKVEFFTPKNLIDVMISAGFEIETQWQPSKMQGLFIIARKN